MDTKLLAGENVSGRDDGVEPEDDQALCQDGGPSQAAGAEGRGAAEVIDPSSVVMVLSKTVDHYFPKFTEWLKGIADPRNQKVIVYGRETLLWMMLLLMLTRLGARRQIQGTLRPEEKAVRNLRQLCGQEGLKGVPHGDTVEYLSLRVSTKELEAIEVKMAKALLRSRVLEGFRLQGKYYTIAIDGVHLYSFRYPHCGRCLVKEGGDGKKQWHHYKLQASLVTLDGLCIPLASEWIENAARYDKQDCELAAFYRLVKKLRGDFPQLPMCILLDSLYAKETVLAALSAQRMEWIVVFKSGSMPEAYAWVMARKAQYHDGNVVVRRVQRVIGNREKRTHDSRLKRAATKKAKRTQIRETTYSWAREEHWDEKRIFNIMTCTDRMSGEIACDYVWLVSEGLKLGEKTVVELAEKGGRCRWKIENEVFNVQKNGGYHLEHCYSRDEVSMKNWTILLDMAFLISQLMEKGSLLRKGNYGSCRMLARKLLEHLCYLEFQKPPQWPRFQIRLRMDST
jgi:hypothetical protein